MPFGAIPRGFFSSVAYGTAVSSCLMIADLGYLKGTLYSTYLDVLWRTIGEDVWIVTIVSVEAEIKLRGR